MAAARVVARMAAAEVDVRVQGGMKDALVVAATEGRVVAVMAAVGRAGSLAAEGSVAASRAVLGEETREATTPEAERAAEVGMGVAFQAEERVGATREASMAGSIEVEERVVVTAAAARMADVVAEADGGGGQGGRRRRR